MLPWYGVSCLVHEDQHFCCMQVSMAPTHCVKARSCTFPWGFPELPVFEPVPLSREGHYFMHGHWQQLQRVFRGSQSGSKQGISHLLIPC